MTCLRWTCYGPTRFIHRWKTIVHVTLRLSDVMDKWNSRLADYTFDWRHVIETAVERSYQARRFIIFLRRLLYQIYIKTSQIINNQDVKIKYTYDRDEIHFSDITRKMSSFLVRVFPATVLVTGNYQNNEKPLKRQRRLGLTLRTNPQMTT